MKTQEKNCTTLLVYGNLSGHVNKTAFLKAKCKATLQLEIMPMSAYKVNIKMASNIQYTQQIWHISFSYEGAIQNFFK